MAGVVSMRRGYPCLSCAGKSVLSFPRRPPLARRAPPEEVTMDFALTEQQELIRKEVAALARSFSLDYWLEKDRKHEYPHEFVKAFAENGWVGLMIPKAYGGAGFGVTEPNAGTDTSRIQTRAVREGDRWIVNGRKVWTTNAQNANRILLLARTSDRDPAKPLKGMTLFFTEFDRKAISVREIEKLGRAAVDSNEIAIENLEIPEANVVGTVGDGFYHLIDSLNPERIVVGIEAVGIGRAALERATQYAKERVVFDRPIGKNQAIAHPLALALAQLDAAELMCLKAAWLFDTGRPCGREANAAKLLAAEAGFNACDAALQTFGGFGYAKEFYVERLWREIRLYKIAPISQQMALNYLSDHVLGLPRSY